MTQGIIGTTVYCPTDMQSGATLCSPRQGHHPSCQRFDPKDPRAIHHKAQNENLRNDALTIFCALLTTAADGAPADSLALATQALAHAEAFEQEYRRTIMASTNGSGHGR